MSRPVARTASKLGVMERRIPRNPKFDGVKSRLDTGASQSKADERQRFINSRKPLSLLAWSLLLPPCRLC